MPPLNSLNFCGQGLSQSKRKRRHPVLRKVEHGEVPALALDVFS